MRVSFLWFFVLLAFLLPGKVSAQRLSDIIGEEREGVAVHRYAAAGDVTVEVMVLGGIASRGLYEVAETVNLGQLLALAGGPSENIGDREIRQTVKLYREQGGIRSIIYQASLEQMLTEPSRYPSLKDGDVFIIEVSERPKRIDWRDGLTALTALMTIIWTGDRVLRGRG